MQPVLSTKVKKYHTSPWALLLGCTALVVPSGLYAATTVEAKTSWAVSRVASVSQGSYCTMAQKYADDTVLTLARNGRGEYSLALDFKEPKFGSQGKQTISVRPQGGASQSYTVTPQSDRTAVVGIGKDEKLIKQMANGGNVSFDIGKGSLSYGVREFQSGQKELGNCIDALQTTNDKTAELVSSPKTGMSSPDATINKQSAIVRASSAEPSAGDSTTSVEGLLAAAPTPTPSVSALSAAAASTADIPAADVTKVVPVIRETPKAETGIDKATYNKALEELAMLREDNAKLTRAMAEQRQTFENKQAAASGAALDELNQKLNAATVENDKLRKQLGQASSKGDDAAKLGDDLQKSNKALQDAQAENKSLKDKLAEQVSVAGKKDELASAVQKANQDITTLKAENDTLKNQIQIYSKANAGKAVDVQQRATLEKENQDLKAKVETLMAEAAKPAVPPVVQPAQPDPQLQQQVAFLQSENTQLKDKLATAAKIPAPAPVIETKADPKQQELITALQAANLKLKDQLAEAQKAPTPAPVVASAVGNEESLRGEIRTLRSQMETVQAEKSALKSQLDTAQKEKESGQMKMAGGSWDLEQATRRYQESQREIQRLGALLQAQDAKCVKEKKEIEYMLFDPAIAKSSQIAMLNSLEDQVAEKEQKVQTLQASLQQAQAQSSPEKDNKIAVLTKQLEQAKADMTVKVQAASAEQNSVITSMKEELAKKNQLLIEAQAKQQDTITQQDVAALKAELAQKSLQLASAQTKLQQAGQLQNASASQDSMIAALRTQLSQTQNQLAESQARSRQVEASANITQANTLASLQREIQQGNQKINELQAQMSGMKTAATRAASVAPAAAATAATWSGAQQSTNAPQNPLAQNIAFASPKLAPANFMSIDDFSAMLRRVGVPVVGGLQPIKGGNPATYRAYSWKTDSLYGSVEMRKIADASELNTVINQYLGRAKSRCTGEFAAVPSQVRATGTEQSKSYEIACVNGAASSSASVLFTYGNNVAMTVAHEGRAEAMDLAMEARDRISTQIR